jgi:peptidyl-prolyl cis-trans isomerase B (cyclophilin B)
MRLRPRLAAPVLAPLLAALALAGGPAPTRAAAEPPEPSKVPSASGLVLDGKPDEAAWEGALRLSVDPLQVPAAPPAVGKAEVTPDVRVLQGDGRLWVAASVAEDVGLSIGVQWLLGTEGTRTAAEAVALSYKPLWLQSTRYAVRGPRGLSRSEHYPFQGAVDASRLGRWTIETSLPLSSLGLADPAATLRLALVITSRMPNVGAAAPKGAILAATDKWEALRPAEGAWSAGGEPDKTAIAQEDARDVERMKGWQQFLVGHAKLQRQGGLRPDKPDEVRATLKALLFDPLDAVRVARPDLAPVVHWVRGELFQQVGMGEAAIPECREAIAGMPGFREAGFLLARIVSDGISEGTAGAASDYAAAFERAKAAEAAATDAFSKDGAALGVGLLRYKHGEFDEAVALLEPLATRYAAYPPVVLSFERARAFAKHWPDEQVLRARDERKGDLPQVRIVTTKGPILLELYEDHAPNTVRNFVWLAEKKFLDGTQFHRVLPFFVIQGGDPLSKEGGPADRVGTGGPGYFVRTESGPPKRPGEPPGAAEVRRAFRGVIAMAHTDRDKDGSQFFITTGTAAHLDGDFGVFGRVLEGQDVAEQVVQGDRTLRVEVVRKRPGTEYRPVTVSGSPAPEPRATSALGR